MYYYLNGNLAHLELGLCVIDCGGVGYKLSISQKAYEALSGSVGKVAKLFTHLAVREDGIELFGFISEDERGCFMSLTSVSGVGPRAAISILSTLTPKDLVSAIATDNAKAIAKSQGIGNKTAARIILELKDKIGLSVTDTAQPAALSQTLAHGNRELSDATEALLGLGYDRHSIAAALSGVDVNELNAGEIIRLALKKMMK